MNFFCFEINKLYMYKKHIITKNLTFYFFMIFHIFDYIMFFFFLGIKENKQR